MSEPFIPSRASEIQPDWLSRVLRDAGVIAPDMWITRINIDDPGSEASYAGQVARLSLAYRDAHIPAPKTIIAKFPAGEAVIRYLFRSIYRTEIRFYREIAGHVPIQVPACYAALTDRRESRSLLLLEDLSTFATTGDHEIGCSDEQAHLAVDRLGRLHAALWDSPALDQHDWLSMYGTASKKNWLIYAAAWLPYQRRLRGITPRRTGWLISNLWRYRTRLTELSGGRPRTLQHGDYRLANLAFGTNDLYVFDWQVVRIGLPAFDLAWFMFTSLTVEQRRSQERRLLYTYLQSVSAAGVEGYSMDALADDLRLGLLQAVPQIMVIGAFLRFDEQRGRMLGQMLERYEALAEDHDLQGYLRSGT